MRLALALSALTLFSCVLADQNTTIDDTSASIQYSDGGHTLPCLFDSNGQVVSGQPGCFNQGPKNCSSGAHVLQTQQSTLSMQFKGSAIYMNALLDSISNVYTVTLDGKATDLDGVRPNAELLCYTLFSQTGLDPTAEHNISLSIKGLSSDRNTTLGNDDIFFFWLDNFVVTTPDANTSSTPSTPASANGNPSSSGSSPSATPTSASRQTATSWISFGIAAISFLSLARL